MDLDAASPQPGDDARIVEITAGFLIQRSWKDQMEFGAHFPASTGVSGAS